jgi:hypothetical protein
MGRGAGQLDLIRKRNPGVGHSHQRMLTYNGQTIEVAVTHRPQPGDFGATA